MTTAGSDLGPVLDILSRIEALLAAGEDIYRSDLSARLSLQRLWICAGEAVSRYCIVQGIDDGREPWSEVRRLRDYPAHHLLDEIDDARPWAETTAWISGHLTTLRATL